MNWDFVKRLRDIWPRKLVIKGIVTREDAELAVEHGVDGLFVSNHGGRAEDSGSASIDSLSEVVAGVAGACPCIVDGGFRRGTDIFKALALGANAVGIGRPYIWGLASFGQEGVEKVLDILRGELLDRDAPGRHAQHRGNQAVIRRGQPARVAVPRHKSPAEAEIIPPPAAVYSTRRGSAPAGKNRCSWPFWHFSAAC